MLPTGASITSVETINITGGAAITANTTSITGVTKLTASNSGANAIDLTGAATTDLVATNSTIAGATTTINGGNNITVTTGELTASAGAGGAISIGATTAVTGAVTVTETATSGNVTNASTATGGAIGVKGGTTVSITQNIAPTSAASTTVLTSGDTVNNTGGAITVTGGSATTAATVTQSAAILAVASASIGRIGVNDGAVTITDVNSGSATAAGVLTTVTLNNYGDATINSGALSTINLSGTGGTLGVTQGLLTTATVTTQQLNLNGLSYVNGVTGTNAIALGSSITTLNVDNSTAASTVANLTAGGATTVNFTGNALLTLTNNTFGAATAINSTGSTGGVSLGTTALALATTFTGGAGKDSIILTANFTKANTMGAGDDTVTYAAQGTGGSVNAGDGVDTIIMTGAQANTASGSSTFNTKFTNFETLRISDAHATSVDLDGINAASTVILAAGSNAGTITNLASGGTVDIRADGTGNEAINVKSALVGANDVLNLALKNTSATNFRQITAANVETINIAIPDAAAAPALGSAAVKHQMVLVATSATSVVVTGNNGLTLTTAGNTAVTNFDASGVVANNTAASTFVAATTDSAANLAVTYASANVTATANVTIKGGAGDDVLSGTIAKDTITGAAGADLIYGDNAGAKAIQQLTLTDVAGTVADTITIDGISTAWTGAASAALDVAAIVTAVNGNAALKGIATATDATGGVLLINYLTDGVHTTATLGGTGATAVAVIDGTGASVVGVAGTVAVDVIDGGSGADLIVGGGGADTLTGGTGVDTFYFLKAQSTMATMGTITDFTFATGGANNDKILLADVVSAIGTTATVQDLSAQATLAAAADAAAATNLVNFGLSVFIWGGNEYVFVETTGATTTYVAGDFVVKLTGLPLAAGATIAGSGFDAV